jgi:phage terminase large subunit-like protein
VNWFSRLLVHTKGEWAGRPFVLAPWQEHELIRPLFGTLNADGTRRYRTAYVEMPRKQGKTELAAGIALYLLFADGEPGAEIYGAAGDRDQASLVYGVAAQMVKRRAELARRCQVLDATKRLLLPDGGFYRAIPADAAGSHGFNAHGVIVDELHVQPNRDLWDVLTTSTGARRQPLTFAITTAGFDRHSICWELHEHARQVLDGTVDDPSFFAYIRAAPEDADWTDEAVWRAANPALGDFRSLDEMRALAERARQVPALENAFRRLYLCQWTASETRWLALDRWDACAGAVDRAALRGRDCYAGLDLASTTDLAALVLVFPDGAEPEGYDVLPFFWVPAATVAERTRRDRVPYDLWVRQGLVQATPGNVIDYGAIRQTLRDVGAEFRIRELGFDRWGATQLAQELGDDGLPVVAMGQGFATLSPPTKELLNLVLAGRLRHGGHPVLRWNADNLVVRTDPAGNLKPDKQKSTEKIDGMLGLVMALDRAIRRERRASRWEREGEALLVV